LIRLSARSGDITACDVDVIVNAANSSLIGGGGVDGAIHRAGGPSILAQCRSIVLRQGDCETGQAVATEGGDLAARWVIHTVGPVWNEAVAADCEARLVDCYTNSLDLAGEMGATTIAFPNISTGVYGYPKLRAAPVAIAAVQEWAKRNPSGPLTDIFFVCFDTENLALYQGSIGAYPHKHC
jgi:O-acetyl-ADP-ribose deacetylase (regulator of RNase III)